MRKQTKLSRGAHNNRASWLAAAMLHALVVAPPLAIAGEGGTSHIMPGANATLVDLPPTAPGGFFKPMYINYQGDISARVPTAAGVVANADAEANTLVLGGGYGFEQTILGGAHYGVAAFLPYTWLSISGNSEALGGVRIQNSVSGVGDLTVVPVMLAWKSGDWQYDFLMPVYAPTGSYEKGRLGNPGLNYWTVDPVFGVTYSNKTSGFNALLHAGYAMNTENDTTQYKSGAMLHFDGAIEQILPAGGGFLALGVEGFYFRQVTGDSGSGATLGEFKGMTTGLGPVIGYVKPLGSNSLALEAKWLTELDTKKRLEGDYLWLRAAYKF